VGTDDVWEHYETSETWKGATSRSLRSLLVVEERMRSSGWLKHWNGIESQNLCTNYPSWNVLSFYYSAIPSPAREGHIGMVLKRMYKEGKTRGNWITQFTWTVMYVCLLLSLFLFPLWGQCCWCMRQFVVGCRTTKPSTSCEDSCCSASMYSLKPTTQVSLTYWCTLNYRWFQNFHMCSVCL